MAANHLYFGDNLNILRQQIRDESVDLVYLDPPFNSNRSYNVLFKSHASAVADAKAQIQAFDDTWVWSQQTEELYDQLGFGGAPAKVADALIAMRKLLGENDVLAYLVMMTARLVELHRVLKPTGSIYLHCDPTASHYLKVMMDAIFGAPNFINEIAWQRTATKGDARRKFGAVHDTLLVYAKSSGYLFNPVFVEKDDTYRGRFSLDDGDGRGPYRLAPLDSPNPRPNLTYDYKGFPPPEKGWRVNLELMEKLDADDRLAFPSKPDGRIARKHYLSEQEGRKAADTWTDIPPLQASSAEKLGYPTQKPLALLERIIAASSNPGDVVLDPFCGCGTAIDAAQKMGRRWVGIDITYIAIDLMQKRLEATYGPEIRDAYDLSGVPRDIEAAQALFDANAFDFERWAVTLISGQPNEKQVGDKGIDGVIRFPMNRDDVATSLVSVKGGRQLNPGMVRDLHGTVERQRAEMGVLVTLAPATRGMVEEAKHSGTYTDEFSGTVYPKIQLISIAEIMSGTRPAMPTPIMPYKLAQRRKNLDQLTLL
jgi:DNA modification methylase